MCTDITFLCYVTYLNNAYRQSYKCHIVNGKRFIQFNLEENLKNARVTNYLQIANVVSGQVSKK